MKNQKHIREELKDAPEFAEKLIEKYGDNIEVDKSYSVGSILSVEPTETRYVHFSSNGRKIGVYTEDISIDGSFNQTFNDKPLNKVIL
ncbi:MAG: hypothetical protein KKB03_02620 [Nanoarchaeota archaeon]|nr:hypothetical protein [Nanoarchaeota archaeon]MBU1135108.1 hypothetical protein [Nanoarchaeota archaeon]MBU2520112.1 hypothetical protein [Nanoarchaeota archaeon]